MACSTFVCSHCSQCCFLSCLAGCHAGSLEQGLCRKDSDCSSKGSGWMCSTDSLKQSCTCTPADGQDKCEVLGTCVEYCQTKAVQNQLAAANSQLVVCDPFLPNTCTGDLVCQSSSSCLQLTCTAGEGIKTARCTGLCLPAVRLLIAARFSDAGDAVVVNLNAPAKAGSFPCSSAFETTGGLGGGASCDVVDQTVSIQ